jgi:drug/metabolite transporter (DMT)-like permease
MSETSTLGPWQGSALAANVICTVSMIVWAAGLPAADLLIPHMPPLELTAVRVFLAAAFLLPLWWALEGGAAVLRAPWRRGLLIGGTMFTVGATLLVIAQKMTDAVTVAVVSATMPVVGMALEILLDRRRVTVALLLGLGLSLLGGILVFLPRLGEIGLGLGALAAFGSVLSFTIGSRLSVTAFPHLTATGRTAITVGGGAVATVALSAANLALGGPTTDWAAIGWREVVAMLIFSVGSLGVSQLMWILAVGRIGIGIASLHINAAPFYVMVFAWALGGAWNGWQALSAAIVAAGVLIAQGVIPLGRRPA